MFSAPAILLALITSPTESRHALRLFSHGVTFTRH